MCTNVLSKTLIKEEKTIFALDLVGEKPVKLYYFFIWFLFTDSACYIRNNPTTIRPLTRYSIYRGNLVRMIFIGFLFHVKVMQKSDKNQTKSHGNIMQTCLHDICMKKCIIIMWLIFLHDVHAIWYLCQIHMKFMRYSHTII